MARAPHDAGDASPGAMTSIAVASTRTRALHPAHERIRSGPGSVGSSVLHCRQWIVSRWETADDLPTPLFRRRPVEPEGEFESCDGLLGLLGVDLQNEVLNGLH